MPTQKGSDCRRTCELYGCTAPPCADEKSEKKAETPAESAAASKKADSTSRFLQSYQAEIKKVKGAAPQK